MSLKFVNVSTQEKLKIFVFLFLFITGIIKGWFLFWNHVGWQYRRSTETTRNTSSYIPTRALPCLLISLTPNKYTSWTWNYKGNSQTLSLLLEEFYILGFHIRFGLGNNIPVSGSSVLPAWWIPGTWGIPGWQTRAAVGRDHHHCVTRFQGKHSGLRGLHTWGGISLY